MNRFTIEPSFWEIFPQATIGVVLLKGINNRDCNTDRYEKLLRAAEKEALRHLPDADFSQNAVIKTWREAFQKFKTKKGARSSVEALLKRVSNGHALGCINPLVDIYNAISIKYALPCGGEDMNTFVGDVRLTKANGNEPFVTLGSDENAPPCEGEIVYKDDAGAICRCWNWRESVRTMLTEETTNAFLCIEHLHQERLPELQSALQELSETAVALLGGTCEVYLLDIDHPSIDIG